MIIDGHAHACGKLLTPEGIIYTLDKCGMDKIILVPGELGSKAEYSIFKMAELFPSKNVGKVTNYLTKFAIKLTGKVKEVPEGNVYVYNLKEKTQGRVIQFVWVTQQIKNPTEYLDNKLSCWSFHGVKLHQC